MTASFLHLHFFFCPNLPTFIPANLFSERELPILVEQLTIHKDF